MRGKTSKIKPHWIYRMRGEQFCSEKCACESRTNGTGIFFYFFFGYKTNAFKANLHINIVGYIGTQAVPIPSFSAENEANASNNT